MHGAVAKRGGHGFQTHWKHWIFLTLSQTTNFRLSKLKEFADNNFKFYEYGGNFSKWVENTVGNGKIAHFSFSFWCFQKIFTADTCTLKQGQFRALS